MPKFILPNAEPGTHVINDRYCFVDGVMPASKADAPMIARILCEYHGCKLVEDEEVEAEQVPAQSGSLAVDNTKTGAAEPQKAATQKPAAEVKAAK